MNLMGTPDVVRVTGVPLKKLNLWCNAGHIPGQAVWVGSGVPRQWTPEQIDRVFELRDALREAISILEDAGLHALARRIAGDYVEKGRDREVPT